MDADPADVLEPSSGVGGLPVTRAQLTAWSTPDDRRSVAMVAGLLGAWAGLGALVVAAPWPLKPALWLVLGFVVNGVVQLGHETWHHNLFSRRWANALTGHVFGLLFALPYDAARHAHLRHHWYNRTPRDPDAYNVGAGLGAWAQFYVVVFAGLLLAPLHFGLLYPLMAYDRRMWLRHGVWFASYTLAYAALFAVVARADLWGWVLQAWLLPLVACSPLNGLKSIADHHENVWQGDRFHTATTVRTHRWLSVLWSGLNYHLDHHLYPRVPGHRLHQVHEAVRAELLARRAPVFDGYLHVWWSAFRRGPTYAENAFFTDRS